MIYYILISLLILFIFFILYIFILMKKINKLEKIILIKFKEKNNQITSLYECTKPYLNKHNEIFKEALILKQKDFSENLFFNNLLEKSKTYKLIHNEFNFIFRVCNKHPKINKDSKFLLIKDTVIDKSNELWKKLILYKQITDTYNKYITIKNITIIWIFIPIPKINNL